MLTLRTMLWKTIHPTHGPLTHPNMPCMPKRPTTRTQRKSNTCGRVLGTETSRVLRCLTTSPVRRRSSLSLRRIFPSRLIFRRMSLPTLAPPVLPGLSPIFRLWPRTSQSISFWRASLGKLQRSHFMHVMELTTSPSRFSRIFKLVNYTEDVAKLLNDSSVK